MKQWNFQSKERQCRIAAGSLFASGREIDSNRLVEFLSAVIHPGDRVCLEGNNQKQADVLARALADADPQVLHDLHMVQSGVVLPEHLDLFEKGMAKKLDFSYSGPQAARMARMLFSGKIELGAIHTYLELFARYFVDLTPQVALIADLDGNLYIGPNTEDTPTVVEATSFGNGIVIARAEEIVDWVPRVDIPSDQAHFFVNTGKPFYVVSLFTRDPAVITEAQILTAMLAISRSTQHRSTYLVRNIESGSGEARPSLRRQRLAEAAQRAT
jgi:malonate decarboxylase alpha subunit